jgi:carboxylesterase
VRGRRPARGLIALNPQSVACCEASMPSTPQRKVRATGDTTGCWIGQTVPMSSSIPPVMPGAEPMSHMAGSSTGVLVLHGFTGNPSSVRPVAEAMAVAGYDVEMPRLPGHGTTIEDMMTTSWSDWFGAALDGFDTLASRCDQVVVAGLSMGGLLTLAVGGERPASGLICVNPVARMRSPEETAMVEELIEDGMTVLPGIGSDIADPDAGELAYEGTPLVPLRSMFFDGVKPRCEHWGQLTAPLLLFTSEHDHVVDPADSTHLASTYGGAVEHVWLERSFHVATQDFDRELICERSVAFVVERSAAS